MKDIYSNKAYDIYINKRDELIESKEFQDLVKTNNKEYKIIVENRYKALKMLKELLTKIECKYGEIDPVWKLGIEESNIFIILPNWIISFETKFKKRYIKAIIKRHIDRIKYFLRMKRRNN